MVGKKKWTIYELCAVRAMLKAQFADGDIIDNFPLWFPEAKHEVIVSSIKHVQLDIFSADAYINLEVQWEDIPGKKGYLLGLFALGMDRDVIANHIDNTCPSHRWPERTNKSDAVDIATTTFHSCADIVGGASPIALYSQSNDGFVLVPIVLKEFASGKTLEMIHQAVQGEVPFDHVVYILTKFRKNFCNEWSPTLPNQILPSNAPYPLDQPCQFDPSFQIDQPYQLNQLIESILTQGSQVSLFVENQTLSPNAGSISAESQPNQQTGGMVNSMIDPLLLQKEAAANYPSPDQWQAERIQEEVMSFKNDNVGAAKNNLKDQQWEGKENLLRPANIEDLLDFSRLE